MLSSLDYMEYALSLAKLAVGYANPSPAVGAVVIKDEIIVGMGYTQLAGSDDAEVMAIRQAGDKAQGAVLYTTLEPCCYYRNGPPCTKIIIDAGISEVHLAMLEPSPLASGRGVSELEQTGIKTYVGEYQEKAYEINEAYIKFVTTGLPFVTAKFAMSLDGKIATKAGHSMWVGNDKAREYVYNLRHTMDAIMIGVNTIIADNLRLNARSCWGKGGSTKKQPLRLVVDSKGRAPLDAHVFEKPRETLLAVMHPLESEKKRKFAQEGIEVVEIAGKEGRVDLEELLKEMGKRGIITILVEGGSDLFGSLFDRRLVDKLLVFISPVIIGSSEAKSAIGGNGAGSIAEALCLGNVKVESLDDNILVSGYVKKRSSQKS